jgi:hypothetical protein
MTWWSMAAPFLAALSSYLRPNCSSSTANIMATRPSGQFVPDGTRVDLPNRSPFLPEVYQVQSHPQVPLDPLVYSFDIYVLLLDYSKTAFKELKTHVRGVTIPCDLDGGRQALGNYLSPSHATPFLTISNRHPQC